MTDIIEFLASVNWPGALITAVAIVVGGYILAVVTRD